ncbi:hemerythrin domain-containing protein [Micromonospora auratinigra]|uniref:Hemerythrin HHE cation binding domain-containing protein n=1 Tax=Micromonospora auratinigra TaxID=261654 RepID=A0A1A8Z7A7_9ACTN|nr:hemerythrin domain-containing protein [Micromonospora auratinigra]SBT39750.1 Hemerythrin HHE cation binding domain-containing protein [Micromonospora auratinigra]
MSTDAIVLLKEDHKEMRRLFREFEKAQDGPAKRRQELLTEILAALTTHTYLENEVMYPEIRKLLPDLEDDILESHEEHHVADLLSAELAELDADDERLVAKTTVLIENVEHHVEEEEQEWFPKVREALGRNQLQEIGERMIAMRPQAPRSPKDPKARKSARDAATA